jgi:hypothetical protein
MALPALLQLAADASSSPEGVRALERNVAVIAGDSA